MPIRALDKNLKLNLTLLVITQKMAELAKKYFIKNTAAFLREGGFFLQSYSPDVNQIFGVFNTDFFEIWLVCARLATSAEKPILNAGFELSVCPTNSLGIPSIYEKNYISNKPERRRW